jgi:hypothetical protein
MLFAFQSSAEDVKLVLEQKFQQECSFERAEELLAKLDHKKIENMALCGDDLEEQTEWAQAEIEKQLRALFESQTA